MLPGASPMVCMIQHMFRGLGVVLHRSCTSPNGRHKDVDDPDDLSDLSVGCAENWVRTAINIMSCRCGRICWIAAKSDMCGMCNRNCSTEIAADLCFPELERLDRVPRCCA